MTEVVDLTFTDSDDEPQPRPSQQTAPGAGVGEMRTPLRHLLALQDHHRNGGALAAEANPKPSPEEIVLLESPDPPLPSAKQHTYKDPNPPKRRQIEPEEREDDALANQAGPSRPPRSRPPSVAYTPDDYANEFADESYERDYLHEKSPTKIPAAGGGGAARKKPKRTREEIARDKELKKQLK
jgi:hypothetical protein